MLKVKETKKFDAATWKAVKAYQQDHDLPLTGTLDQPTWASLSPSSITSNVVDGYAKGEAIAYGAQNYSGSTIKQGQVGKAALFLQTALGMPAADRNGFFNTKTLAAVQELQASAGLTQDGVVRAEEWQAMADAP